MSLWYLIMVPRPVRCEGCDGHGIVPDDPDDPDPGPAGCTECNGTGATGEVRWGLHPGATRLYETASAARGVIKRDLRHDRMVRVKPSRPPPPPRPDLDPEEGRDYRLLLVDADACEALDDRWTTDRQFEHAADRALLLAERALKLQPSVAIGLLKRGAGEAVTVAIDAIREGRLEEARAILAAARPEEPKLDAQDWEVVRRALSREVRANAPGEPGVTLAERADDGTWPRARDLLARLDACAALQDLYRQRAAGAAMTTDALIGWATGQGPRRCWRSGPAAGGMAATECGDTVPMLASTDERAQVACPACEAALARAQV